MGNMKKVGTRTLKYLWSAEKRGQYTLDRGNKNASIFLLQPQVTVKIDLILSFCHLEPQGRISPMHVLTKIIPNNLLKMMETADPKCLMVMLE